MIVGLIGKKRSGKDTFASGLVEGRGFTRFAFADPMKEFALALDPAIAVTPSVRFAETGEGRVIHAERLSRIVAEYGWEVAKEIPDVRRTLQRLGTDAGRKVFGENFWVEGTMNRVFAHDGSAVITDVRFPNEAQAVTDAGGLIVRIVRPGLVSEDPHPSETALDGYPADLDVLNAGTAESLRETARLIDF